MYVPACLYMYHIIQVPVEALRQDLTHWNQSNRYDELTDVGTGTKPWSSLTEANTLNC